MGAGVYSVVVVNFQLRLGIEAWGLRQECVDTCVFWRKGNAAGEMGWDGKCKYTVKR